MSSRPNDALDGRARAIRHSIWPDQYDMELSRPWPGRHGAEQQPQPQQQSKRWTGASAWDFDGRASRLSYLAGGKLLPGASGPAELPAFAPKWPSPPEPAFSGPENDPRRTTWLKDLVTPDSHSAIWGGAYDVEKRPSFARRLSDRWSGSELGDIEKEKTKPPPTDDQLKQTDKSLVTPEVLQYPFDGAGTPVDPYQVTWIDEDPANPMRFSPAKKWMNALILSFAVFIVSIATSAFSAGTSNIRKEFGIDSSSALLTTSLFTLGFAVGGLVLSPLSELYGRQKIYIGTYGAFVGLSGGIGLASSFNVVLVLRFLSGIAGSFTQADAPAILADIFETKDRGIPMSIAMMAGLMGQQIGPICGGFLNGAFGWRSISILVFASSLPTWILLALTFPETYAPAILRKRASRMTAITGDTHVVPGMEENMSLASQLRVSILRPFIMLAFEPTVLMLGSLRAIVQGTLFLLFAAYPIVFGTVRGWSDGISSLPFLAIALGIVFSVIWIATVDEKRYAKLIYKYGTPPPEMRLPLAMIGATALPIGLFWFAWTNSPNIYWLASVSAGVPFGFGMNLVYISLTNYLVDAYLGYAASAMAASTVLRSIAGATFPLFTDQMFAAFGIHWGSCVPAFITLAFLPVLFLFYKFGHVIRSKTRFGQEAAKMAAMLSKE